jgi:superfamily II DNA helicase RecQ
VKILFITPETAISQNFTNALDQLIEKGLLNFWIVDEAHCICKWVGGTFRPKYANTIIELRSRAPNIPCICLTATASPEVQGFIKSTLNSAKLEMLMIASTVYRSNLYLDVKFKHLLKINVEDEVSE